MNDRNVDSALAALRDAEWTGSASHPELERRIKENTMSSRAMVSKRMMILAVAAAALGSSAVTAGVMHLTRYRVTITSEDGQQQTIELTPEGMGEWTNDDGSAGRVEVQEQTDGATQVEVELEAGDESGSVTATVDKD